MGNLSRTANHGGDFANKKDSRKQLSSDEIPGYFAVKGTILPSDMRILISHYKDPIMNQPVFHGMSCQGFVVVARLIFFSTSEKS